MAASYGLRHWSANAGRVRHSPPSSPGLIPSSSSSSRLRAQTAHPSLSVDFPQDDDIIEEIDHILDDLDVTSDTEDHHFYRLDQNEDGSEMADYEMPPSFVKPALMLSDEPFGVSVEQLKKYLQPNGSNSNNNEEEEESKETSSLPAYRRHPSDPLLPDYLIPNAVHHVSSSSDDEAPQEVSNGISDEEPQEEQLFYAKNADEVRIGAKSQSVASFNSSSSPGEMSAARQRSLPARRNDTASARMNVKSPSDRFGSNNGPRKMGVMPSSVLNRRSPAGNSSSSGSGFSSHSSSRSSSNKYNPASAASTKMGGLSSTNVVESQHQLDPRTRLQSALKSINSSDWEDKIEGIRRLEELLVSSNGEMVAADVHTVALALLVEVKNLRSQVSRAAIQSIGKMFQHCGKHVEQDLERAVSLLLNKSGDTNRFIRDDAHVALLAVTEYVSPPKAIIAIATEGLSHKNAAVRAEAAKLLVAIVDKLGPAKTLSGAKDVTERILPAAAHFIQDGSLETRAQAKRIFSVLMSDPIFDRALHKYLPAPVIRNIQRTLDQLRKNF